MTQRILIHGLGQNTSAWDNVVSAMPEPERIYCPDLFALLEQHDATYTNIYRAFSMYCDSIPGSLNLCGLSLGAMLVLQYSLEYPDKVSSIVLIGAQYKAPKLLLKLQNGIFRLLPARFFSSKGIQKEQFIRLTASMSVFDFSNKLGNISCPSLIACGEKDRANRKAAEYMATNISKAQLQVVAGAGHEVNVDAPQDLASLIQTFFEGVGTAQQNV